MPDGEIYDPRDDGANGTCFGYLKVLPIPSEGNPVIKIFFHNDLTRGLQVGRRVEFHVEIFNTTKADGSDPCTLPVAIVTKVLN